VVVDLTNPSPFCVFLASATMSLKRPAESECSEQEPAKNPNVEEDEAAEQLRLEAKREYNRINAARARKRTKDHIAELCGKVQELEEKNATLEAKNQSISSRVSALIEENKVLRLTLLESMGRRHTHPHPPVPQKTSMYHGKSSTPHDKFAPAELSMIQNPLYGRCLLS
jgi:bZIP transcription factor